MLISAGLMWIRRSEFSSISLISTACTYVLDWSLGWLNWGVVRNWSWRLCFVEPNLTGLRTHCRTAGWWEAGCLSYCCILLVTHCCVYLCVCVSERFSVVCSEKCGLCFNPYPTLVLCQPGACLLAFLPLDCTKAELGWARVRLATPLIARVFSSCFRNSTAKRLSGGQWLKENC